MPKITAQVASDILELTRQPLEAKSSHEFFEALRDSHNILSKGLLTSPRKKQYAAALEQAFERTIASRRQRHILEACSWPIFDKPGVPSAGAHDLPEFLWLFCIPFVVRFSQHQLRGPLVLPTEIFDGRALLRKALANERFNTKALLSGFPTLVSRDDLHLYGPSNIAKSFISAELGGTSSLQPLPFQLDREIESGKVRTFFMLAAARLPVGEKQLFKRNENWPAAEIGQQVLDGLLKNGVSVEQVLSMPPCSIAEALFRCTPVGSVELGVVLTLAKEYYDIRAVSVSYPMEGMAELSGFDSAGEDFLLCSPFSFIEPKADIRAWVERSCEEHKLVFKGAFSLAIPSGSMTH